MIFIIGLKFSQKRLWKNTLVDSETQKLEKGSCREIHCHVPRNWNRYFHLILLCLYYTKKKLSLFDITVLITKWKNRHQLTSRLILNFDNLGSQTFSLIATSDLSTSHIKTQLWLQPLGDSNSSIKDKIINAAIFFHLGNFSTSWQLWAELWARCWAATRTRRSRWRPSPHGRGRSW